ncbi:MAG: metal-sensing transcriptional repressor, partial [Firmicutes bacterium]|nr:metal-sensing transcriptional repressor [Bacillota bacterium]
LKNINKDVLEAHLNNCVLEAFDSGDQFNKKQKIDEMIKIVDKLTR